MNKDSIIMYTDWIDLFDEAELTEQEQMELVFSALKYAKNGVNPAFSDRTLKAIWTIMRARIDQNTEKYEARCEANRKNGSLGGRPKISDKDEETENRKTERLSEKPKKTERLSEKPKKTERFSEKPKKPDYEYEYDYDYEYDYESESDNARAREGSAGCPSIGQVRDYFLAHNYTSSPDAYWAHYNDQGWTVDDQPVKSWERLADAWERRQIAWQAKAKPPDRTRPKTTAHRDYDYAAIEAKLFG